MRDILVICSKYSSESRDSYLTNDIVDKLTCKKNKVTVLSLSDTTIRREREGLKEVLIGVKSKAKIFKYFIIWPSLLLHMLYLLFTSRKYDQIIVMTTLTVKWPSIILLPLFSSQKKTYIIFDIFPTHQVKISALPVFSERLLWFLEFLLIKNFNEIICMGSNNKKFVTEYYKINTQKVTIKSTNLWSGFKGNIRPKVNTTGKVSFVFGGQVIRGRRLDLAINFLNEIRLHGVDLTLDIYSQSLYYEELDSIVKNKKWITFHKFIPRADYIKTISSYDIGLIVTDCQSDLPTFPSKIIDYAASGIAAFCIVEKESELFTVTKGSPRVFLNAFSFSENDVSNAIDFLESLKTDMRIEAKNFHELFSLDKTIQKITSN